MVTGFGRLGQWFASRELFDVQPDILITAKGITSGYQPLGAAIFSDEIWQVISEKGQERCFTHGYTYSGHPVACAAALKNIEIMEREYLFDNVNSVGPYFEAELKTLEDLPIVGQTRGCKFMVCVEFVADRRSKALFPEALDIGKRIANQADARGLIVRPLVHLNVMSPPLTMGKTWTSSSRRCARASKPPQWNWNSKVTGHRKEPKESLSTGREFWTGSGSPRRISAPTTHADGCVPVSIPLIRHATVVS